MSDEAQAQDKDAERFPEKVTLKVWDKQGKKFLNAYENLPAKKIDDKDGVRFSVKAVAPNTGIPRIGSEITEKDGTVWVVDKVTKGTPSHFCYVTKKP